MNRKHWSHMASVMVLGCSFPVLAGGSTPLNTVPKGFEDLVQPQRRRLSMVLASDSTSRLKGAFMVTGDHVTYTGSPDALAKQLVSQFGIKSQASKRIANSLKQGVDSSLKCQGFRTQCPLAPEEADYVFVSDSDTLILHINPKWMNSSLPGPRAYIDDTTDKSALIMAHEFSYNATQSGRDSEGQQDYSYYNDSYLGLGSSGYLHTSANYSSDNGLSADDISLNMLRESTRTRVGYVDQNQNWNNTAFLENNTTLTGYAASFGSTNALRSESTESAQRVYFSAPRAGRLEVKNPQGRVLVSRNIQAGQQYLSYSELPKGTYTVSIRVYDGTTAIYEENRLIVNNAAQDGSVGDVDYLVTMGYLSRALTNTRLHDADRGVESRYDDYDSPLFSDAKVATRLSERMTLGGGALATVDDAYAYAGMSWLFDDGKFSVTGGVFDDSSAYYSTDFYLNGLSLTWRRFDSGEENHSVDDVHLSDLLFNDYDFNSLSASYYYSLDNMNTMYLSGSWNTNESENILGGSDSEVWVMNAGYTMAGLPADTQATFEWGVSGGNVQENDYTFNINLRLPLGTRHSFNHNTFIDHHSGSGHSMVNHRDTLSSNWLTGDHLSISTDVSTRYAFDNSVDNETDLSTSVSGSNDYFSGSGYAYLDSAGARSGNVFLKTNTVTTKDHTFFTKDEASSYLVVENKTGDLSSTGKFTSVVQGRKNRKLSNAYAISKSYSLHPLDEYAEYEFVVDNDASDFYNNGESGKKASSYPGNVIDIKTELGELKTFISTFTDIQGNSIDDVECVGQGCVETEQLTDGVYQFKVKENLPYKLLSKAQQCVIPAVKTAPSRNLGTNFCMPSFEEDMQGYQIAKFADDEYFYYVGKFAKPSQVSLYKNQLLASSQHVRFVEKVVDDYTYVFIKTGQLLTAGNLDIISELMSYAVVDDDTRPYASN
ncbi:CS1-pili formation C-terminal domain-containing protein [Vibrio owensii]|uniref:CS1-pili formation C-terminal domain-containing protein n=1 Tax=Vibrio owensii TaxID=696485 RepID=UPI0018F20444|nr:CS1-pili formation C-terminal domain-containing protein [Vibrio owensii]